MILTNGCFVKRNFSETANDYSLSGEEIIKTTISKNISGSGFYLKKAIVNYSDSISSYEFLLSVKYNKSGTYLAVGRSMTGIEVFRLYINRDSFLINDRFNKRLIKGSEEYLKDKFGFDFKTLIFVFGDLYTSENLSLGNNGCAAGEMGYTDSYYGGTLNVKIDCNRYKTSMIELAGSNGLLSSDIELNNFLENRDLSYPQEILISSKKKSFRLEMKIVNIECPWSGVIDFIPGNNYEIQILK